MSTYGIDLGTTYSCISHIDEFGQAVVIPNSLSQFTTPSVVYFESEENIVVGQEAKDVAVLFPENVIASVKRQMGDPDWKTVQHGKEYTPQGVSSFILRKLIKDASVQTGDDISDVVITCPAYFGVTERTATQQAGEIAGLNVRHVIPEPTAAAIAYGIQQNDHQVLLVYDLGGGTFDVTVIEISPDGIRVVCTGGEHSLGGKDWDAKIINYLAHSFSEDSDAVSSEDELFDNLETQQDLLIKAEEAKVSLSDRERKQVQILHGVERQVIELTREIFNQETEDLLQRTINLTKDVLQSAAEKGASNVDRLLLVGGATYMPQVERAVTDEFQGIEVVHFEPNQAVAKGAAIFGQRFDLQELIMFEVADRTGQTVENLDDVEDSVRKDAEQAVATAQGIALPGLRNLTNKDIINVTSKSFGVVVVNVEGDKVVQNLVTVDDAVPTTVTQEFVTHEESNGVLIECVENILHVGPTDDPVDLNASDSIGAVELVFANTLPAGSPVDVTFSLAADGLLFVNGKDKTTSQQAEGEFKTGATLTREEVEKEKSTHLAMAVS